LAPSFPHPLAAPQSRDVIASALNGSSEMPISIEKWNIDLDLCSINNMT